ncbi:MAG: PEGA domain-containing protein [Polyangiaceae bacterium]|nr:PEGA domain-containing protein [Polyangiaceae bacterium]
MSFAPLAAMATLAFAAFTPPAWAQGGQAGALAEALFRKGVDDMKAGRYETGCPAVDESHRLDPRPGTLFTLAECNAKWGKLATAVAHYDDFLRGVSRLPADKLANYKDRVDDARRQKDALSPRVPRLTVSVAGGLPSGAKVTCDGLPLGAGALDLPLPLNPGEHELTVQREGGPAARRAVRLEAGEMKRIELPAPPPVPPPVAAERGPEPGSEAGSTQRTLGFVLGGVGVAGLVVGGIAGAFALSSGSAVERECPGRVCTGEGYDAVGRAKDEALVANLGLGVGVAGLVAGTVLVLTAESPRRTPAAGLRSLQPTAFATPSGGWVGLGARF